MRDLAELQKEYDLACQAEAIVPQFTAGWGKREFMDALMEIRCKGRDLLPQIEVMLSRDAKDFMGEDFDVENEQMQHKFWANPDWVVEPKLDGNRFMMHITPRAVRFDSRRRSDSDYAFSEKTGNFPHFQDLQKCRDYYGLLS